MEKTTVYLTSQQKAALAQAADAEGRSEARLIRAGIDVVIARHQAGERAAAVEDEAGRAGPASPLAKPRWIDRESFVALLLRTQADAALGKELRDLAPGTTDDEPIP